MSATQTGVSAGVMHSRVGDFLALIKLRVTTLVVVAALVGFYIGFAGPFTRATAVALAATILGMALVVGGANAINQLIERRHDARMQRTADRPLAAGRLSVSQVLWTGAPASVAGLVVLALGANMPTAVAAAIAWVLYVFAYTPLKRVSPWSVLVGAVPGALPPVIGWTAAAGALDPNSLLLFAIMFVWQLPHFLAIAWMYREDYASAGYRVLSVVEPTGKRVVVEMIAYSLVLIPVSLLPTYFGIAGHLYYFGAMVLGFAFLAFSLEVARLRSRNSARQHLYASLAYLSLLFILLSINKIAA